MQASEAQEDLQAQQASLPRASARTSSSLGTNVLAFVAFLAVLLVVIYSMNKGKPKEATMFSGGPAPATDGRPSGSGPPPASAGPSIEGTLELADGTSAPAGAVVFVTARPSGGPSGGPPLAVRKIDVERFPHPFRIGAEDVMIPGRPWVGPVDLTVRLDQDGDALTRTPGDLSTAAPLKGIELGQSEVRVILERREGS
jgi:hypothetical protein